MPDPEYLSENVKQYIVAEHQREQKDKKDMERALREAEIALMPPGDRFDFASQRFYQRKEAWNKELQRILQQYRKTVLSCPFAFQKQSIQFLQEQCPYLVMPKAVGERIVAQIREAIEKQVISQHPSPTLLNVIKDMNHLWVRMLRQYLGFSEGSLPHPDILPCIVPNAS